MKNLEISRLLKFIGPHPYNPLLIFSFFSACFFSRFIPLIVYQPQGLPRYVATLVVLALAIIPSSILALIAFLFQNFRKWSSNNLLFYFCEVSVGEFFLLIFAPFVSEFLRKNFDFEYEAPLTLTPGLYFGTFLMILLCLGLLNKAELSVIRRLEAADNLAIQLQRDREELIFSDEELRQQTSRFLHDRVQSDLMVVSMKLKGVQSQIPSEVRSVLDKSIARLESIRSTDLRNLIQILTPNFDLSGLQQALNLLKEQYKNSIHIDLKLSIDELKLSEKQSLGIFRIAEQSLLNSLVHGPAQNVQLALTNSSARFVTLTISDDGPGVNPEEVTPGVGSAIIDSWVNILSANKKIESTRENGYKLTIEIPLQKSERRRGDLNS